jgi:hypothetical protein
VLQHNFPKVDYELNGVVIVETECSNTKLNNSICVKKLENIKIVYSKNSHKGTYMTFPLDTKPRSGFTEADCIVMNEEIFGCKGIVRRGEDIEVDSEITSLPNVTFKFHRVITSKFYNFLPNSIILPAETVDFFQNWLY